MSAIVTRGATILDVYARLPLLAAILSVLTLVGVVADAITVLDNQKIEVEVQRRQLFINQTQQLGQVGNALMQALGSASINGNDAAIRDLLTEYGITVNANATPADAAQSPKK